MSWNQWDETKRLVYVGVFGQYGCGSVAEIDAHLIALNEDAVGERSMIVLDAIAFDRDRLLELRTTLTWITRLNDGQPLYPHDILGQLKGGASS